VSEYQARFETDGIETDSELAVSGLSAAHTIYLAGGNVVLLDKNSTRSQYGAFQYSKLTII
jgi:hypothetical protein